MIFSRFSHKIILLAVAPLSVGFILFLIIQSASIKKLSVSTESITEQSLHQLYQVHMQQLGRNMAQKVALKISSVRQEILLLSRMAQQVLDDSTFDDVNHHLNGLDYFRNHYVYDADRQVSHLQPQGLNIGANIWGYLHDDSGIIDQAALAYLESLSALKVLFSAIGDYGIDKSYIYIIGPKSAPVIMSSPWTEVPVSMDEKYPGHNKNNFWDFFFPGLIEGWQELKSGAQDNGLFSDDEMTLTPIYEDAAGKGPLLTFFSPLWQRDGLTSAGAVALDYQVNNLISLVQNEQPGNAGFAFLLQGDGSILGAQQKWTQTLGLPATQSGQQQGVKQRYLKLQDSQLPQVQQSVAQLQQADKQPIVFSDELGSEYLLSFHSITGFNLWTGNGQEIPQGRLYLGLVMPSQEIQQVSQQVQQEIARESANTRVYITIFSVGLAIVVSILTAIYGIRQTRQISLMSAGLRAIREGDFSTTVPVVAKDDLGELAQGFNNMSNALQTSYQHMQQHTELLEAKVEQRTRHLRQANEELQQLAQKDGLTNLYNRRYLDALLGKTWRNHLASQHPMAVLIVDVDHFKRFNDIYGHQAGDACLCRIADVLQKSLVGPEDVVARYGGEEFCLIIDGDAEEAGKLAEVLRNNVAELRLAHQGGEQGKVTISVGASAVVPADNLSIETLVVQADKALYQSKASGRNRVSVWRE